LSQQRSRSSSSNASPSAQAPASPTQDIPAQKPIILDCRNDYESVVGHFEGAQALPTATFRDTFPVLQKMLHLDKVGQLVRISHPLDKQLIFVHRHTCAVV